ncbi:hypothetical protein SAMN06265795_12629 [Noviherbaspirillum humi]|uniref:RcsF protein n=1 Tax=Noviherbaspirillum humi TaxID=1688639 RepID=A0A239LV86_9BURK|nr:hypothetical protein SAMN06265795_12629 [Noviherbaspirillum humi]
MRVAVALLSLSLAACASSSGVQQIGRDTYSLSAGVAGTGSVSGNNTASRRAALTEANNHCLSQGKEINLQNIGLNSTYAGSTTEIVFQCLSPSEAAMTERPTFRKEADTVVEVRK